MSEDNYKERYENLREDYIKFNYKVEKTLGEFMRGICQEPDGCIYPLTGEEDGECLIDGFSKYIEEIQRNVIDVLSDVNSLEYNINKNNMQMIHVKSDFESLRKRILKLRKSLDLIKVYTRSDQNEVLYSNSNI